MSTFSRIGTAAALAAAVSVLAAGTSHALACPPDGCPDQTRTGAAPQNVGPGTTDHADPGDNGEGQDKPKPPHTPDPPGTDNPGPLPPIPGDEDPCDAPVPPHPVGHAPRAVAEQQASALSAL